MNAKGGPPRRFVYHRNSFYVKRQSQVAKSLASAVSFLARLTHVYHNVRLCAIRELEYATHLRSINGRPMSFSTSLNRRLRAASNRHTVPNSLV